jgi:arsenate reductase
MGEGGEMKDVLLHNPRCSKSRGALELLRERGVDVPVREYLKDAPSEQELRDIIAILGVRPVELARRGEPLFKELALSDASSDDAVLRALAANPVLIERPVLVYRGRAIIGRPPERILDLL